MLSESSSQASGIDTDADGSARVEYGATMVAPRPFLRWRCQTFLRDTCVGPQDSVWVCKSFADGFAVIYFGFLRRRLKRDFVRGTIFAQIPFIKGDNKLGHAYKGQADITIYQCSA